MPECDFLPTRGYFLQSRRRRELAAEGFLLRHYQTTYRTQQTCRDYNLDITLKYMNDIKNIFDVHYKTFGSGLSAAGRNFICSALLSF